jgi:hypothetical protein
MVSGQPLTEPAQWNRLIRAINTVGRKCRRCHSDRVTAMYCEKHRRMNNVIAREQMRRKGKGKWRNANAESYHVGA